MKQKYSFFKTTMPDSRPADFYLGCQDSSVFIDFNLNEDRQIYIKRISFDGYGCCELKHSKSLDGKDTLRFINEINKDLIDQNTIELLVKKLIKINKDQLWIDVLEEYELL